MYRLTLVKSFNTDEIRNYADLVKLGRPDFIEVKVMTSKITFTRNLCNVLTCAQGVTYCGESKASSLTMENVPWHREVVAFVEQLVALLPDYAIASEHEHSNCLLVAHSKVRGRHDKVVFC